MSRDRVGFWLAVIGTAVLAVLVTRLVTPDSSNVGVHLDNAYRLSIRRLAERDSIRKAEAESDKSATASGRQGERVSVAVQVVDSLIRDTLRVPVRDTVLENAARTLSMSVLAYMDTTHAERMARLRERAVYRTALATQDSLAAAWEAAYKGEKGRKWRYRAEGSVVGLLVGLLLVVAL